MVLRINLADNTVVPINLWESRSRALNEAHQYMERAGLISDPGTPWRSSKLDFPWSVLGLPTTTTSPAKALIKPVHYVTNRKPVLLAVVLLDP